LDHQVVPTSSRPLLQLQRASSLLPAPLPHFSGGLADWSRWGRGGQSPVHTSSSSVWLVAGLALVAFGVMPPSSSFLALARSAGTRKNRSPSRRSRWTKTEVGSGRSSSPNNLAVWCRAGPPRVVALSPLSCHRGDGGGDGWSAARGRCARRGSSAAALFRSTSSAALRRPRAALPSTLMAERRPLRALTYAADLRVDCRRQLIFNLPADAPKGRPFSSRSAALFGGFVPSGYVPGDGAAGRDWMQRRELGGQGLDCFSYLCSRVLVAKGEALVVLFIFQKVLHVKCIATALI